MLGNLLRPALRKMWAFFYRMEVTGKKIIVKLQGVRRENSLQYID
jgi:hypothetical protein